MNYGIRYHKGLPISSSIAESAVNLVVSHRMAKKQQMRWTDEGAHCLAQVRVAVLNEEFSVEKLAVLTKTSAVANSRVCPERRELTSHGLVHSRLRYLHADDDDRHRATEAGLRLGW